MKSSLLMNFTVDKANNKITVEREFSAPVANVWAAWTQPELLDQWWAPKPWKTNTKSMDFREGGTWFYSMNGPDGEAHWCRNDYKTIDPMKSFSGKDGFTDAEGNLNTAMPVNNWKNEFNQTGDSTTVTIQMNFDKLSDLEATVEMGFKEGFTMALENLDALLEKQS